MIEDLNTRASTKLELKQFKDEFNEYRQNDPVARIIKLFNPKFADVHKVVAEFKESLKEAREAIQTFDHALSLKANKSALMILEQTLTGHFVSFDDWEGMRKDFKNKTEMMDSTSNDLK